MNLAYLLPMLVIIQEILKSKSYINAAEPPKPTTFQRLKLHYYQSSTRDSPTESINLLCRTLIKHPPPHNVIILNTFLEGTLGVLSLRKIIDKCNSLKLDNLWKYNLKPCHSWALLKKSHTHFLSFYSFYL